MSDNFFQETDVLRFHLQRFSAKDIIINEMDSSEEEELALLAFVLIDEGHETERKKRRKHRFWVREIFKQRDQQGVFSNLLRELRLGDRENFFRFVFLSSYMKSYHHRCLIII